MFDQSWRDLQRPLLRRQVPRGRLAGSPRPLPAAGQARLAAGRPLRPRQPHAGRAERLAPGHQRRARVAEEQTADLGLLFDTTYPGPGLRIREILAQGPADQRGINLKAGDIVRAIDGAELTDAVNLSELLNDKVGETVTLSVTNDPKDPSKRRSRGPRRTARPHRRPHVRPLGHGERQARRTLSKGKLGYIHIPSMDEAGLDEFVRTLYSDNFDKDAIVLDVRYNGGGFTHDQVLNYLGGKEHTFFLTRDGGKGTVLRERPQVDQAAGAAHQQPLVQRRRDLPACLPHPGPGQAGRQADRRPRHRHQQRAAHRRLHLPHAAHRRVHGRRGQHGEGRRDPGRAGRSEPDQVARNQDAQLDKAVEVLLKDVELWKKNPKPDVIASPSGDPAKNPATGPGSIK